MEMGGMGGEVFPRTKERDPYRRLGIDAEASPEEVQDARNYLVETYRGHTAGVEVRGARPRGEGDTSFAPVANVLAKALAKALARERERTHTHTLSGHTHTHMLRPLIDPFFHVRLYSQDNKYSS
jgi:hypothetical protein